MLPPKVSVCIVTYNHERYIHDCIMSVIAQGSDVTLEILVGDDLSTDSTPEIIGALAKEYSHLIRYFGHKKRLGYGSKNYQALIREACGTYIAHLDGDDFWLPGKLAAQISFLEKHPDCSAVYSNALAIKDNGEPIGLFNNHQPSRFDVNALLKRGNFLNNSSMCYRSDLRNNLLEMKAPFLDYRINLCHALYGPLGYLNQALVGYRVNSSSSIIVHSNDLVRSLYWEALLNVPIDTVNSDALAHGMAEFARSVFFRSLRINKISLFNKWLPTVLKSSPVGKTKMLLLVFGAIFRVAIQEVLASIFTRVSGNQMKILYRR
jgi:glycosyltransferase involved in cell wall biosynthesis